MIEWYMAIFWISLSVGILVLVGTSVGLVDFDVDGDFEGEAIDIGGADLDDIGRASVIDLGRVPFTMLLLMSTLIFGVSGIFINMALSAAVPSYILGWASLVAAFVIMFFLTKRLSRLIIKHMPTTETDSVSKESAKGSGGILIVDTDKDGGLGNIQIPNKKGVVSHQRMQCRSESGLIPKGSDIVVTHFDSKSHICTVTPLRDVLINKNTLT